jgi:RND superfamily putative drug exporter
LLEIKGAAVTAPSHSAWRRWSQIVQARPWPPAIVSLAVMVALLVPVFAIRLDSSDAGNDPASVSSRHAFDLLAKRVRGGVQRAAAAGR